MITFHVFKRNMRLKAIKRPFIHYLIKSFSWLQLQHIYIYSYNNWTSGVIVVQTWIRSEKQF